MAVKSRPSASAKSKAPVKSRTASKKRVVSKKSNKPSFAQKWLSGRRKWVVVAASLLLIGGVGAYMLRPSSAVSTAVNCRQYSTADSGTSYACVKYIQRMINGTNYIYSGGRFSYAYYSGLLEADGYFGSRTKAAVMAFQQSTSSSVNALEVDGVVGTNTWGYLCYRVQKYRYDDSWWLRSDAYKAGLSAGCTGSGWPTTTTTTSTSTYALPVNTADHITSCYGMRDLNGDGYKEDHHDGVDMSGSYESVYSVKSGVVTQSSYNSWAGNYLVIKHSDGVYAAWYQHLSSKAVSKGQSVKAGQKIGVMGTSGGVPKHLHFSLVKSKYAYYTYRPSGDRIAGDVEASKIHMKYISASQLTPWGGSATCYTY